MCAWDFAGQEVYYATHQFFVTERAMVVLVFRLTAFDASELVAWVESLQDSAEACVPMRWKSLACTAALGIASESLEPLHFTSKVRRPDIQCVEPEKLTRCFTHIRACARATSLQ